MYECIYVIRFCVSGGVEHERGHWLEHIVDECIETVSCGNIYNVHGGTMHSLEYHGCLFAAWTEAVDVSVVVTPTSAERLVVRRWLVEVHTARHLLVTLRH